MPCIVTEGYFWQIVDSSLLRFQVIQGISGVIGQLGRQEPAATLGQHCNQMTQKPDHILFTPPPRWLQTV